MLNLENKETHYIPTIINSRILEKEESTINPQRTKQQRKMNRNTARETVSSAHKVHNILIISDSHSKGLAVKIQNCLDDSFKIYGLIKPNADIQQITSQLNTGHLIKEDIVSYVSWWNK